MKKLSLVLLLVVGLGVGSAGMVQADPIVGRGWPPWYAFLFGGLAPALSPWGGNSNSTSGRSSLDL